MTACASEPQVFYVHETPDTPVFPVFPPPDVVTYDDESDTVSMPLWYWQDIAEYKISVDAIHNYLTALQERERKERSEAQAAKDAQK
jgi:hypothetical protein